MMLNVDNLRYKSSDRDMATMRALSELKRLDPAYDKQYIIVINMREPSFRQRLYVVDINSFSFIENHHVSHGKNSSSLLDPTFATRFSNKVGSRCSSLGGMKTGEVYTGIHGKSLRLYGLEKGINDNVGLW
jgi:hypothetical protein